MEFATEHKDKLNLLGFNLTDLHEMLVVVFGNAYFTFDNRLYLQLVGLLMGCKPSLLGAIMRVYTFERRNIYIDPHFLPMVSRIYVRYVDDAGTVAKSCEEATAAFSCTASQDPDVRLGWEIDFPESDADWTPFLDTQIRIDRDGKLYTKFYRKEQKKHIALNLRSQHPMRTKIEVARNFYKSARECSSSPELEEESYKIVDNLLRCNGYSSPRDMMKTHIKGISVPPMDSLSVCLKLPYISEQISDQILKLIKNCGLPIRVVFTPGKKLRNLFCCSRPYDKPVCESKTCQICSRLVEGKDCSIMGPIYISDNMYDVTCITNCK